MDQSWASGNSFGGATLWTDGSLTDCMMPPIERPFIKCYRGGCLKTFWIESAQVVHRVDYTFMADAHLEKQPIEKRNLIELWRDLSNAIWYDGIDDCYQAIQERIAGRKKSNWKWLRTFTWHEATSPFRGISEVSFPVGTKCILEKRHASNLSELAALLDASDESERLQLIEVHRQQAEFAPASDLLEYQWSEEVLQLVEFLRTLISSGDTILRRVPDTDSKDGSLGSQD